MRENWQEIISNRLYRSLPLLISAILLLFSYLPLRSEIAGNARPVVGLMCVYFWLIYRADLFNLFSVFVLGLIADTVSTVPFGSNLLSMLVMYLIVTNLVKYLNGKTFMILWFGLAALLPAAMLSQWLALSIYYHQFLPLSLLLFSYITSLACYPLVGGINALILNHFLQDDEQ